MRIEGGQIRQVEPISRGRGTSVEVSSLFFNVPARRKFLKTVRTELRRSIEVVQGYALARPDIAFSLHHDGKLLLETSPGSDGAAGAKQRIAEIFGASLADHLVEIPSGLDPLERIWGFVGDSHYGEGTALLHLCQPSAVARPSVDGDVLSCGSAGMEAR